MSWSGSGTIPPSLNTAIVTATNNNVTLIASAGNENNSNPRYPASHALVLGVAALNEDDTKHGSSSYGTWIDISAPAFNVFLNYVPGDPNPHQYHSGAATSTASPFVSGLAALILSVNSSLSDDDARNIILNTPDNVDAANPSYIGLLGAGRINAYQALLLTHAYSNKSVSSTATASNNGRRIVKTSDNRYHLVFESGVASGGNVLSEIFYRRSNSGGTSWETPTRLSAGDEQNRCPSIVERVDGTTKKLYAVWQRKTGTNTYNILFRHFNGSSWETIQTITSGISLTNDPLPALAICTPSASFEMMVVYRTNSGLQSRHSTSLNGTSWGSEVQVTSNTSARNPSVTYSSNDYANFDVAWDNRQPSLSSPFLRQQLEQ